MSLLLQVFGAGGRSSAESAVSRVVAAGFPADVAKWALDNNKQDVGAAIRELRAVSTTGEALNWHLVSVFFSHMITIEPSFILNF